MKESEMTHQESLEIISDMIGQAKKSFARGGSFYFLLWGFAAAAANLSHYLLEVVVQYDMPYVVWLITIPTMVVSILHGRKQKSKAETFSHFDKIYGQIWLAMGLGMVCTIAFMPKLGFNHGAVILLFAAGGTYISGSLLRFNPLKFGGLVLFLSAIGAFSVEPSVQQLIAGLAIIVGYIVPGFMLKKEEGE